MFVNDDEEEDDDDCLYKNSNKSDIKQAAVIVLGVRSVQYFFKRSLPKYVYMCICVCVLMCTFVCVYACVYD